MSSASSLDADMAARLVLLSLKGMGPARTRWLLGQELALVDSAVDGAAAISAVENLRTGKPAAAYGRAPAGITRDLLSAWQHQARSTDGAKLLDQHREAGIAVLCPGHEAWPFSDDPEPPPLVFAKGDVAVLSGSPTVGIVGTRRCTSVGRRVASQFGRDLAEAGVVVASGLALGIDGAAHYGAMGGPDKGASVPSVMGGNAPVIGVVATGLDVVYPPKHASLWQEVAKAGVLISESPLGTAPQRWRFPARNRLLAGLVDVLIVIESHESGGALSTVEEAVARSVEVGVVPGSVLSAASSGTNALLMDGCVPVCSAADVLGLLGLGGDPTLSGQLRLCVDNQATPLGELEQRIMQELETGAVHLDGLIHRTSASLADVAQAVQSLQQAQLVSLDGSWIALWGNGE